MNYADIKKVDVANGEGIRVSVFVSGCNHHCEGCFNKCAWDFNYGNKFTEKNINEVINYLDHEHISGLSLLGGEPLEYANQEGLLPLVKKVKEKFPSKNIWCYTGFDFEKDVVKNQYHDLDEFLNSVDMVVIMVKHDEIREKADTLIGKIVLDCQNVIDLPGVFHI